MLSCCRRGERKRRVLQAEGHTEAALGGGGRQEVPSDLWTGVASTLMKRRKAGAAFEGHCGRQIVEH